MDEAGLIEDAQRGDINAFNTLVLHYQDAVYNMAYRVMGEHHAASDAVQEAFISAYRGIERFRGGSFKSWLMRIVTNACYDELRRRKRRPTADIDVLDYTEPAPLVSRPENPEAHAEHAALSDAIQGCINALPDDQRMIAVLCDVQGCSYQEAADIAGVSLGTVKSRLSRARGRLRVCLGAVRELLPRRYRLDSESSEESTR
ncbi:MAG: sigma-70 family RNA polymerase sigma factor [Anaerolineae bacterium]|nr:sigma-70 family RNA polymerase sigma factor [Anaerolineae bacterium]